MYSSILPIPVRVPLYTLIHTQTLSTNIQIHIFVYIHIHTPTYSTHCTHTRVLCSYKIYVYRYIYRCVRYICIQIYLYSSHRFFVQCFGQQKNRENKRDRDLCMPKGVSGGSKERRNTIYNNILYCFRVYRSVFYI